MYKNYRKLKAKATTSFLKTSAGICYCRKAFDKQTGDELLEPREDIIDIDYLKAIRVNLQSELDDIDDLISDFGKEIKR